MTGLRIVFDRERNILGWKKFNCKYNFNNVASGIICGHIFMIIFSSTGYESESFNPLPVNPKNSSALSPTAPKNYSPEAMKGNGNGTQVTVLTPPRGHSSHLNSMSRILILLWLSLTIL